MKSNLQHVFRILTHVCDESVGFDVKTKVWMSLKNFGTNRPDMVNGFGRIRAQIENAVVVNLHDLPRYLL